MRDHPKDEHPADGGYQHRCLKETMLHRGNVPISTSGEVNDCRRGSSGTTYWLVCDFALRRLSMPMYFNFLASMGNILVTALGIS